MNIEHPDPLLSLMTRRDSIIAIAASFTAEPIEASLVFWMRELNIRAVVEFAPYNQIFQQLLDPVSLLSSNSNGINIILVRLEDWLRFNDVAQHEAFATDTYELIKRNVQDLILALKSATEFSKTPYLVCLCSASNETGISTKVAIISREQFTELEDILLVGLGGLTGVYTIRPADLVASYPVTDSYDPHADTLGHIPFTPVFFAALGTLIARKIYALRNAPYKVVVLDCDQTLWKGVCGEDGVCGIEIDAPRKALQEFMVAQHDSGMLICLCSRNNEMDVVEVFEQRRDMPLKREHIVSWRINWHPKSENIKSLAEELGLGLDSLIFVDDDPLICAEVEANCPEVVTALLPAESADIPKFLNHIWAFDHLTTTVEDAKRTDLYKKNVERERSRKSSLSFEDFIAGLNLQIQISELAPHHINRAAQLTQRTNQFNISTRRRSEADIQNLCVSGKYESLVVEVSDRFGNYGLVGLIIFEANVDVIKVDTFLLSCRVLGRGVENRMLARLGEIAKMRGQSQVELAYIPTQKNQPAFTFLNKWGEQFKSSRQDEFIFTFPAEFATTMISASLSVEPVQPQDISRSADAVQSPAKPVETFTKSALFMRIAGDLSDPERVLMIMNSKMMHARPDLVESFVATHTSTEKTLASIWSEVLSVETIGIHDNFFDLGGDSVSATQIMSRVRDTFMHELPLRSLTQEALNTKLSIVKMFQYPTVSALAKYLSQELGGQPSYNAIHDRAQKQKAALARQMPSKAKILRKH